jgi:hypothetical protein
MTRQTSSGRKSNIYDCCDQVNRLLSRLRLRTTKQPISRLGLTVNLIGAHARREGALHDVQTLLRSFQRLCHVFKPELLLVKMPDALTPRTSMGFQLLIFCIRPGYLHLTPRCFLDF